MKRRLLLILIALVFTLTASILISIAVGSADIPLKTIAKIIINHNHVSLSAEEVIILQIRLPRVFLGVLIGMALSVSGTTMQALFKNPMGDPYIIGISSGAAFGAVLAMQFSYTLVPLMAVICAISTAFVVYNLAKVGGKIPVNTLLLSGIAVGYFLSAITSFMMFKSGENLNQIVFWIMGGLWNANWNQVKIIILPIFIGMLALYIFSRDMNVMLLGEESAETLGIDVETLKKILLIISSIITATAVSMSGIIGFVGLIVPHIMRIVVGPDHRILLPTSAFTGGTILLIADTIARTMGEIPVGVVTALFGTPFFIYLLRSRKSSY
ncbi:MAG: iron ABC transporter permease [Candidatus Methanoliparum thermophilum]|uniref:Iron ABC transporter permease n=1 Tax=Methanoliparum thermophilum TaxID=2491083 RepID=A0A520KT33_METT2|nr:MAG: iron ABC transporter permease [Candidatus Methanoliparum thermophilum]